MCEFKIPSRLDALNASDIENELIKIIDEKKCKTLICDFTDCVYISSAGLRVMLKISKKMLNLNGRCVLKNMQDDVFSIFEMAGFHTILNIEK
jgi:anti-anti-sigma factor